MNLNEPRLNAQYEIKMAYRLQYTCNPWLFTTDELDGEDSPKNRQKAVKDYYMSPIYDCFYLYNSVISIKLIKTN